jgi:hypothetical protein
MYAKTLRKGLRNSGRKIAHNVTYDTTC